MEKITIKTKEELEKMVDGGEKLAQIKKSLKQAIKIGTTAADIEKLANDLIEKSGGKPSFKEVPGYHWATCVNINEGLVHGIPKPEVVFRMKDVVSVDVGLYYEGFHTDTSFTIALEPDEKTKGFLNAGEEALANAIKAVKVGNRIYDISSAIENAITKYGFVPIRQLVGHGVGKSLHEEPQIPCFTQGIYESSPEISEGMVLAIEVMYTQGKSEIQISDDGWTISTADGKISALYEETVATTMHGPLVLTKE